MHIHLRTLHEFYHSKAKKKYNFFKVIIVGLVPDYFSGNKNNILLGEAGLEF